MEATAWDTLINMLVFLLWFRLWSPADRPRMHANPYLAPVAVLSHRLVKFLEPLTFGVAPRLTAVAAGLFLVLFRGVLAYRLSMDQGQPGWTVVFGFERLTAHTIPQFAIFSLLSFAIFVFRIAGFALLYAGCARRQPGPAQDCVQGLAVPFSRLPPALRPVVLLLIGAGIAAGLRLIAGPPAPAGVVAFNSVVSALAGFVDILGIIVSLLMLAIVLSWVILLVGALHLQPALREWTDLLLGPARRWTVRAGAIDLTPLLFFLVVGLLIHPLLRAFLAASYW